MIEPGMIGLGMPELIIILILLFIPIAIIAAIMVLVKILRGKLKACPHCAEKIKAAARVCRYCGRDAAVA